LGCKARLTTIETLVLNYPFVIKKDGRRESFNRDKILRGLQAACQKRPISLLTLEVIVDRISRRIMSSGENEIPAAAIGNMVMTELKKLDDVAYVRFASVYRTFKDVQEFVETLDDVDLTQWSEEDHAQLRLSTQDDARPNPTSTEKETNPT
jgi:transcriptional repressor NrdR